MHSPCSRSSRTGAPGGDLPAAGAVGALALLVVLADGGGFAGGQVMREEALAALAAHALQEIPGRGAQALLTPLPPRSFPQQSPRSPGPRLSPRPGALPAQPGHPCPAPAGGSGLPALTPLVPRGSSWGVCGDFVGTLWGVCGLF